MLRKRQRKESQKQSLELSHKSPMNTIVNHYRHTIYSKYSTHYFYNIALYPLHFSKLRFLRASRLAGAWLAGLAAALAAGCRALAKPSSMLAQPERKHRKPNRIRGIGEGYSSADSVGDEESAESMLVDPVADLHDIIESIP